MRQYSIFGAAILGCILYFSACKSGGEAGNKKAGKWLPYPEQAALEEQNLRRALKVEKREAMSNTFKDSVEAWFPSEIILYNQYGQPTLSQFMDASGIVTKETKYEYKDSLLVREWVQESSGYKSEMQYTYNDKGQKIGELYFQRGDSVLRREYTLDNDGNEVTVSLFKFRDGAKLQLLTDRDAQGRPAKVREVQNDVANWSEAYAMTDTLWRIKRTNSKGELQSDYEMRFDGQGAIVQMINRSPEGNARLTINYVNDAQGHALKEQFLGAEGQPMQATEFRYNEKGLLIERSVTSPNIAAKTTTRFSYFYRKGE